MKKAILALFASGVFVFAKAQNDRGSVSVTIVNDQQSPLENATVELLKSKDSSLVKVALTDKKGVAEFESIPFGNYLARATMVNYSALYSSPFELSGNKSTISLSQISLSPVCKTIGQCNGGD